MRSGNVIIALGAAMIVAGVGVRLGLFNWFGKLPGDIRSEGERGTVFAPITSMLVLSVLGSIIFNLIIRLFRDGR